MNPFRRNIRLYKARGLEHHEKFPLQRGYFRETDLLGTILNARVFIDQARPNGVLVCDLCHVFILCCVTLRRREKIRRGLRPSCPSVVISGSSMSGPLEINEIEEYQYPKYLILLFHHSLAIIRSSCHVETSPLPSCYLPCSYRSCRILLQLPASYCVTRISANLLSHHILIVHAPKAAMWMTVSLPGAPFRP